MNAQSVSWGVLLVCSQTSNSKGHYCLCKKFIQLDLFLFINLSSPCYFNNWKHNFPFLYYHPFLHINKLITVNRISKFTYSSGQSCSWVFVYRHFHIYFNSNIADNIPWSEVTSLLESSFQLIFFLATCSLGKQEIFWNTLLKKLATKWLKCKADHEKM